MDRDSTTSLIGFPSEAPPKQGLASTISAAGRFIGQKVRHSPLRWRYQLW